VKPSVPPRNWKMRITDILQCIAKIRRYTKGYTFDAFQADEKTIDSVLRNLEIIGEAARHVPAEIRAQHPELPWAEMLIMRNIVIHEHHLADSKGRLAIVSVSSEADSPRRINRKSLLRPS
jgi:uncharacterized protein with HEPN domain